MILSKDVVINTRSKKQLIFYREKGYDCYPDKDFKVKVEDLYIGNVRISINVKCEECGKEHTTYHATYLRKVNDNNGIYRCKECQSKYNAMQKWGVKSASSLQSTKDKVKNTCLERYGSESTFSSKEIKDKIKNTMLNNYGVDNPLKSKEIRNKIKDTNLKRHGVEHVSQRKDIKDRIKNDRIDKRHESIYTTYKDLKILNISKDYNIDILCDKCNKVYTINTSLLHHRYTLYNVEPCINCNKIGSYSNSEVEVVNYIKSIYKGEVLLNSRSVINPQEIDIFIPEKNIGFEFNGVYWHSEIYKSKEYHYRKSILAKENGVHIVHIWEDDWMYKKDIVKSRIKSMFGKSDNVIYARRCVVKEVDSSIAKEFQNACHLQGHVNSIVKVGLYYENELVSLMTFGGKRKSLGQKPKEGEYELLRFCNKLNCNVVGGASRLLKYFVKTYNPIKVISYADCDWTMENNSVYLNMGFDYIGHTGLNYEYVINGIRTNRFKYRKDILVKEGFDKNKTEHDIMMERGHYRVYRTGNYKYVYIS